MVGNYLLYSYRVSGRSTIHNFCAQRHQKSDFQNRKKKNRKVDLQKKNLWGKNSKINFRILGGTFSDTVLHNFYVSFLVEIYGRKIVISVVVHFRRVSGRSTIHNFCAHRHQKSDFRNRKKKNPDSDLQKKITGKDLYFYFSNFGRYFFGYRFT
jgi:hypothetical protein